MTDDTKAKQLLEAFEEVEMGISCLYSDLDEYSDEQDDGRFLTTVHHLAETSDAITAARNAFKAGLAVGDD
jgi:hypothetical protein